MPDKYVIEKTDLTSVANAIREKNKTSDDLMFPDGFISAIQAGGGADLNFEVVGGTTKPSNPRENTIWINTNTAVNGWCFGNGSILPSHSNGFVYIMTSEKSNGAFNALKENSLFVYPFAAIQYQNESWEAKEAKIYQNGVWKDWWDGYYLYYDDQYSDITGGWVGSGSVAKVTNDGIRVETANAAAWNSYMCTSRSIDLSKVNIIRFYVSNMYNYSNSWLRFVIYSAKNATGTRLAETSITSTGESYINVSNISSGYITIQAGNTSHATISWIKCD